ncbi:hypothetical protein B0T09DRAFT_229994, partial [Sordaria sp. MPI-SDFR-AT-0083]
MAVLLLVLSTGAAFLSQTGTSSASITTTIITNQQQQQTIPQPQHQIPEKDTPQNICKTHDQPNPLVSLFPNNATGVLNATLAIIPIPLALARRLVPSGYSILESTYRSLLGPGGFPEGMYPVLLQAAHDHDIQLKAYGIVLDDFSRVGFEFPFLDLSGDGYSSYRWAPAQLISAGNDIAIDGSRAYGTRVSPARFEPECEAYQTLANGNTYFKGTAMTASASGSAFGINSSVVEDDNAGLRRKDDERSIELEMTRLIFSSISPGSPYPYPLDFFKNITNQPTFASSGGGCDNMIRLFDTSMSKGKFAPVSVRGRVKAVNVFPFVEGGELDLDSELDFDPSEGSHSDDTNGRGRQRKWEWIDVYGVQVATPFVENNYLDCEAMSGASTYLYEYGGLQYVLWPGEQLKIIYSDARAKTVGVLVSNDQEKRWERQVSFKSETHRYGDFDCHPGTPWVLAVEEDHTYPKPEDVKNNVALIHIETGEARHLRGIGQHDFVAYPRFNPTDMTQICHIHWDHPNMPFW